MMHDIMMMNVMQLFICIVNYAKLYDVFSNVFKLLVKFKFMYLPGAGNEEDAEMLVLKMNVFFLAN